MTHQEKIRLSINAARHIQANYFFSSDRGDLYLHQDDKEISSIVKIYNIKVNRNYSAGVLVSLSYHGKDYSHYVDYDDFLTQNEAVAICILSCLLKIDNIHQINLLPLNSYL